jgi:PAS domain S-box-containing protein
MTDTHNSVSRTFDPAQTALFPDGGECGALFRSMDWARHPLGPVQHWPSIVQNTLSIMLGSRQAMFLTWGPQNHMLYNDAYAVMCGKRHPASFGAAMATVWHDIWDTVEPLVATVKAGESIHLDNITFVMHRNGYPEVTHFSFSYTPLRDNQNTVEGLFCACVETTEKVRLQRALDHERIQLSQIFEHAPNFIMKMSGPNHIIEVVNPVARRLIGDNDVIGKSVADAFPEVIEQGFVALLDTAYKSGAPQTGEGAKVSLRRLASGVLEDRFVDFVYQPTMAPDGAALGILSIGTDVTDRVLAQTALAESEQFLRSIIAASPDCIKVVTLDGHITFFSDGGRAIMEVPDGHAMEGLAWPDLWGDAEKPMVLDALAQARAGNAARFQGYADTLAGHRSYWDVRVTPMRDAQGTTNRVLVVSRDITHLKQIEDERQTLTTELSHRLKNAFAMVQSVINQTLRQAKSVSEGREILSGRVRALAAAQDILTQSMTSEMRVDQVVEAALLPHRTGEGRFVIAGPKVSINGRQSLGLSLALHELATNATKYGALSGTGGIVNIGWSADMVGAFSFHWQESGGPVVSPPAHNGFGSILIEKIVATYFNGAGMLRFPATGVTFQLTGTITASDVQEATNPY